MADSDSAYPNAAIRVAVEEYYNLPRDLAIVLDLDQVYPHLGREWRDVFDLFREGYGTKIVSDYYSDFSGKPRRTGRKRLDHGNWVVKAMVAEVQRYLTSPMVGRSPYYLFAKRP